MNATLYAPQANFDSPPEELMGAIGAAAPRAENLLPVMAGDQALVALASSEEEWKRGINNGKRYTNTLYEGGLDGIALVCPHFKCFVPLIKQLGVWFFEMDATPDATNSQIMACPDELEAQVKKREQELKDRGHVQ